MSVCEFSLLIIGGNAMIVPIPQSGLGLVITLSQRLTSLSSYFEYSFSWPILKSQNA